MARYRTELHIPIKKDNLNFQDRQMQAWEAMEARMESRRKEWEHEFENMRSEFFTLKPSEKTGRPSVTKLDSSIISAYEADEDGIQKFKMRFEVSEFKPDEIQVKVQENKLIVSAKHVEKSASSTRSREYSRQVDIPDNVDQDRIQCILSKDGVLTVDGPVMGVVGIRESILPVHFNSTEASPRSHPMTTPSSVVRNPIVTEADGSRKLRLQVDIGEFTPEEIVVKTMDKKLIVHAAHEEKRQGRTMSREFNKEYELPESVDPMTVNAYLGDDGKLVIEAPLKSVARPTYSVSQSQDIRKVVVNKESSVTVSDGSNRPMVTINVHRR